MRSAGVTTSTDSGSHSARKVRYRRGTRSFWCRLRIRFASALPKCGESPRDANDDLSEEIDSARSLSTARPPLSPSGRVWPPFLGRVTRIRRAGAYQEIATFRAGNGDRG